MASESAGAASSQSLEQEISDAIIDTLQDYGFGFGETSLSPRLAYL